MVSITTPGYMAPLFTTDLGHLCLLIAAVLLIAGTLVMRRMIRFEL
jgi:tight adherence protein B